MTIYELNKSFKSGISLFYSASYGSLQFGVKKLLEGGYIEIEENDEDSRNKKIYHLTASGRAHFLEWMRKDEISSSKFEVIALTKLYFLGLVNNNEDKRMILQKIIATAKQAEEELFELDKQLQQVEVPEAYKDIFKYQMKSLNYGIRAHQFSIAWFEEALMSIEAEADQAAQ